MLEIVGEKDIKELRISERLKGKFIYNKCRGNYLEIYVLEAETLNEAKKGRNKFRDELMRKKFIIKVLDVDGIHVDAED